MSKLSNHIVISTREEDSGKLSWLVEEKNKQAKYANDPKYVIGRLVEYVRENVPGGGESITLSEFEKQVKKI